MTVIDLDPNSFESEAIAFWLKSCDGDGDEGILRFARWCADRELEGCVDWLKVEAMAKMWNTVAELASELRAARRPKLPSLKERIATAIARGDNSIALGLLDQALPD